MIEESRNPHVRILLIVAIMLGPAAVVAQTVKTSVDPGRDFSGFVRYAWQENRIAARQTPEVVATLDSSLKKTIDAELAKKGYLHDPQTPDFFIHVDAGPEFESKVSANVDFRLPPDTTVYRSQNPSGLGVNAWLVVISHIQITVTDPSSEVPAWQAEVTKKYKDPDKALRNLDSEIGLIVKKGLKSFPSRKKTQ